MKLWSRHKKQSPASQLPGYVQVGAAIEAFSKRDQLPDSDCTFVKAVGVACRELMVLEHERTPHASGEFVAKLTTYRAALATLIKRVEARLAALSAFKRRGVLIRPLLKTLKAIERTKAARQAQHQRAHTARARAAEAPPAEPTAIAPVPARGTPAYLAPFFRDASLAFNLLPLACAEGDEAAVRYLLATADEAGAPYDEAGLYQGVYQAAAYGHLALLKDLVETHQAPVVWPAASVPAAPTPEDLPTPADGLAPAAASHAAAAPALTAATRRALAGCALQAAARGAHPGCLAYLVTHLQDRVLHLRVAALQRGVTADALIEQGTRLAADLAAATAPDADGAGPLVRTADAAALAARYAGWRHACGRFREDIVHTLATAQALFLPGQSVEAQRLFAALHAPLTQACNAPQLKDLSVRAGEGNRSLSAMQRRVEAVVALEAPGTVDVVTGTSTTQSPGPGAFRGLTTLTAGSAELAEAVHAAVEHGLWTRIQKTFDPLTATTPRDETLVSVMLGWFRGYWGIEGHTLPMTGQRPLPVRWFQTVVARTLNPTFWRSLTAADFRALEGIVRYFREPHGWFSSQAALFHDALQQHLTVNTQKQQTPGAPTLSPTMVGFIRTLQQQFDGFTKTSGAKRLASTYAFHIPQRFDYSPTRYPGQWPVSTGRLRRGPQPTRPPVIQGQYGKTYWACARIYDDLQRIKRPQGRDSAKYRTELREAFGLYSLVHLAAAYGVVGLLRAVLHARPAQATARSWEGLTPLMLAAAYGETQVVQVLIEAAGVDVTETMRYRLDSARPEGPQVFTALDFAVKRLRRQWGRVQGKQATAQETALLNHLLTAGGAQWSPQRLKQLVEQTQAVRGLRRSLKRTVLLCAFIRQVHPPAPGISAFTAREGFERGVVQTLTSLCLAARVISSGLVPRDKPGVENVLGAVLFGGKAVAGYIQTHFLAAWAALELLVHGAEKGFETAHVAVEGLGILPAPKKSLNIEAYLEQLATWFASPGEVTAAADYLATRLSARYAEAIGRLSSAGPVGESEAFGFGQAVGESLAQYAMMSAPEAFSETLAETMMAYVALAQPRQYRKVFRGMFRGTAAKNPTVALRASAPDLPAEEQRVLTLLQHPGRVCAFVDGQGHAERVYFSLERAGGHADLQRPENPAQRALSLRATRTEIRAYETQRRREAYQAIAEQLASEAKATGFTEGFQDFLKRLIHEAQREQHAEAAGNPDTHPDTPDTSNTPDSAEQAADTGAGVGSGSGEAQPITVTTTTTSTLATQAASTARATATTTTTTRPTVTAPLTTDTPLARCPLTAEHLADFRAYCLERAVTPSKTPGCVVLRTQQDLTAATRTDYQYALALRWLSDYHPDALRSLGGEALPADWVPEVDEARLRFRPCGLVKPYRSVASTLDDLTHASQQMIQWADGLENEMALVKQDVAELKRVMTPTSPILGSEEAFKRALNKLEKAMDAKLKAETDALKGEVAGLKTRVDDLESENAKLKGANATSARKIQQLERRLGLPSLEDEDALAPPEPHPAQPAPLPRAPSPTLTPADVKSEPPGQKAQQTPAPPARLVAPAAPVAPPSTPARPSMTGRMSQAGEAASARALVTSQGRLSAVAQTAGAPRRATTTTPHTPPAPPVETRSRGWSLSSSEEG